MKIEKNLKALSSKALKELYALDISAEQLQLQKTNQEFEGQLTLVVFPFLRASKKGPEQTANEIGGWLVENSDLVVAHNAIKGFLNLTIISSAWLDLLSDVNDDSDYGQIKQTGDAEQVMVEYSSPNTNKPLHLGHIRNILLGHSLSQILLANGKRVVKTNIVNDRGIHICKSMLAWKKWGNGETPESSAKKGDHLVGDYYVLFDKKYKAELKELEAKGLSAEEAEKESILMGETREMLRAWEAGDEEVHKLWEMMNSWVYKGFDLTYGKLGVEFDKIYYESETYIVGRDVVLDGLAKGIFYKKEDGSVWVDLEKEKLDQKILLRADGTSVYMTQDIGTAKLRYDDYSIDKMIYVVGNEQNYHFQVLAVVLGKLGFDFGKDLYHFSYGMVELPDGKMKSREGTVVDADDLIDEMVNTARKTSEELGKLDGYTEEEAYDVSYMVAMAALKYFILKVDAKKNMTFNPAESIDFNGNTGPFIQYTHARIQSVLRKAAESNIKLVGLNKDIALSVKEEELVYSISQYPNIVKQAGDDYNPALIANYTYDLVKEYNQFYHDFSILKEESEDLRNFRLVLSKNLAKVIKSAMNLLGCRVPDRM